MGARQSIQGDIERRPRSNSTIEAGVEVHGSSGRRPISHYHREASSTSDLEEDADNVTAGLANLGISSALSSSTSSSPTAGNGRNSAISGSAPSPSHHTTFRNPGNSAAASGSSSTGLRFSFRPSNRTSFLQALAGGSASTSAGSTGLQSSSTGARPSRHSVPLLHLIGRDIKCPICHKKVPSDDVEVHLVMCFTRPKIAYNDDVLENEKGECAICLEDMSTGETIARLPCLCIYHKVCIDEWFKRKNCCPEHPGEEG